MFLSIFKKVDELETVDYPTPPPIPATALTGIPGLVEAEEYDDGGQGVAYSDTEPANLGGVSLTSLVMCRVPDATVLAALFRWLWAVISRRRDSFDQIPAPLSDESNLSNKIHHWRCFYTVFVLFAGCARSRTLL